MFASDAALLAVERKLIKFGLGDALTVTMPAVVNTQVGVVRMDVLKVMLPALEGEDESSLADNVTETVLD